MGVVLIFIMTLTSAFENYFRLGERNLAYNLTIYAELIMFFIFGFQFIKSFYGVFTIMRTKHNEKFQVIKKSLVWQITIFSYVTAMI